MLLVESPRGDKTSAARTSQQEALVRELSRRFSTAESSQQLDAARAKVLLEEARNAEPPVSPARLASSMRTGVASVARAAHEKLAKPMSQSLDGFGDCCGAPRRKLASMNPFAVEAQ